MSKPKPELFLDESNDEPNLKEVGDALLFSSGTDNEIFFDESGNLTSHAQEDVELTGEAAMRYLLGKNRPHQQLICGDHREIAKRFKPLIEGMIQNGKDPRELFWSRLKIRVWKVSNVGQKTASIRLQNGKNSDGNNVYNLHQGGAYTGDIFDGKALEGFVPNLPQSPRHTEFRVQLLSVKVSEDMNNVHRIPR